MMAWNLLNNMYNPKGSANKIDLRVKLMECKWKQGEEASKWFGEMDEIVQKLLIDYKITVDEDEQLALLMKGLPTTHKDLKLSFLRQMDSDLDALTVDKFKKQVRLHEEYCEGLDVTKEMSNMALCSPSAFATVCLKCGKPNHSEDRCWKGLECR